MSKEAYIGLAIGFLIGGGFGLVFGWLLGRGRRGAEKVLSQQLNQREADLIQLRGQLTDALSARASTEASRAAAEKLVTEQRTLQDKALADLREAFKALSADALKQTAPEFLRLANETFGKFQETAKGDLAQRQEAKRCQSRLL